MRFITEFEVPESAESHMESRRYIPEKRFVSETGMGNTIAKYFGWQNPVNHDLRHHRLEIEAFPMDKWIEFKNKLLFEIQESAIHGIPISPIRTLELIKSLESFGQPTKDSESLLDNDIQYRGPNSHCKACEEEKAGIKHIKASKHTCKK